MASKIGHFPRNRFPASSSGPGGPTAQVVYINSAEPAVGLHGAAGISLKTKTAPDGAVLSLPAEPCLVPTFLRS